MKNKRSLLALAAAMLATTAFGASGVFDFETSARTPISTKTADAVGWSDYLTPGSVYGTTSTASHGGYLTVSGEYCGGVVSNSASSSGTTYMNDVDTYAGGASSGSNYGVLFLATAYGTKSTAYGTAYYTNPSVFIYDDERADYLEYVDVFDSHCFLFSDGERFNLNSIDVGMTAYTYDALANGNYGMGKKDATTYNNIANNEGSFFAVRMYGVVDSLAEDIEDKLTDNYVEVLMARNDGGAYFINGDWRKSVELSALNVEDGLEGVYFEVLSSFGGSYGLNAPAYVAIDNLSYSTTNVPEPAEMAGFAGLFALAFAVLLKRRVRK
jgi:hypothetical protein